MFLIKSFQQRRINSLLQLLLVVILVFASWHVSTHNIDFSNNDNHSECQVCRLNNTPITDLVTLVSTQPVFIIDQFLVNLRFKQSSKFNRLISNARAPPVLI